MKKWIASDRTKDIFLVLIFLELTYICWDIDRSTITYGLGVVFLIATLFGIVSLYKEKRFLFSGSH